MAFDYRKLRGRILEKYGTQALFAQEMNMSERTLSLKLNNKIYFKQDEIAKAATLLEFSTNEIQEIFFSREVQ